MKKEIEDFSIYKDGHETVIQIIDKCWHFNDQDFTILKTFMFSFLSDCMDLHKKKGYIHSSDIDFILKKYQS